MVCRSRPRTLTKTWSNPFSPHTVETRFYVFFVTHSGVPREDDEMRGSTISELVGPRTHRAISSRGRLEVFCASDFFFS